MKRDEGMKTIWHDDGPMSYDMKWNTLAKEKKLAERPADGTGMSQAEQLMMK
jgi:hypothetical protein